MVGWPDQLCGWQPFNAGRDRAAARTCSHGANDCDLVLAVLDRRRFWRDLHRRFDLAVAEIGDGDSRGADRARTDAGIASFRSLWTIRCAGA